jgi:hypothetical protein
LRAYDGTETENGKIIHAFFIMESLGSTNFSNNFDKIGSKLIDFYDFADLPGF